MPQLDQIGQIYASQLFWLAIVFALIYFGIGKAMVPRIERTIDDRAARIAGDLAAAEQARAAAQAADEHYHSGLESARAEAHRLAADAQARSAAATEGKVKAGDAATEAELDRATARIEGAKRAALAGIEAATVDAVEAIVAKLSGVSVDRATAQRKVQAELAGG